MITRLKIEGLFGRFDYDLVFKDRVTILTGPNGFGKSTVLRILAALSAGNYRPFYHLNFDKIYVGLSDWKKGRITPIDEPGAETVIFEHDDGGYVIPRIRNQENCLLEDQFYLLSEMCDDVKMISEQRLISPTSENLEVINNISKRLKAEMDKLDNEFAKKSSEEDVLFSKRIKESEEITEQVYEELQKQLNYRFNMLRIHNIKNTPMQLEPYCRKTSAAMKAFFETNINKYSVFDEFLEKIILFTDIVNKRLMFKKLVISREKGFEIIDDKTNTSLALEQLSSGEKQVIVMYYELIFIINKNLLLLIDEPEISMHVSWQSKFMEDLIRIAEHGNFRAIVATHSPDIINGLWDLQIDLGEQYQGNLYGENEGESHGD